MYILFIYVKLVTSDIYILYIYIYIYIYICIYIHIHCVLWISSNSHMAAIYLVFLKSVTVY